MLFILRSFCWLAALVMLLPPSGDGQPSPRVSLLQAAYAAGILARDITGVCDRNEHACATSREAATLLAQKLQTGGAIVSAGLATGNGLIESPFDKGTLTPTDIAPRWAAADTAE